VAAPPHLEQRRTSSRTTVPDQVGDEKGTVELAPVMR